jgi:hypothetical protein
MQRGALDFAVSVLEQRNNYHPRRELEKLICSSEGERLQDFDHRVVTKFQFAPRCDLPKAHRPTRKVARPCRKKGQENGYNCKATMRARFNAENFEEKRFFGFHARSPSTKL